VGRRGVRRERPAADRLDDGLRGSEGGRIPEARARHDGDAHQGQSARRQGHRRDRHDRLDAGGLQRGDRRAGTFGSTVSRTAADSRTSLARDPGGKEIAMYSAEFDYYRAKSVAEAAALLRKHKNSKLLAGGHSLLPAMRLRLASPSALVDIGGIRALSGIKAKGKSLEIGAMTTHAAVAASDAVRRVCPILAEAAAEIGDVQVRNRGTIGGSLAHADPGADYPTVLLALGATMTAMGAKA